MCLHLYVGPSAKIHNTTSKGTPGLASHEFSSIHPVQHYTFREKGNNSNLYLFVIICKSYRVLLFPETATAVTGSRCIRCENSGESFPKLALVLKVNSERSFIFYSLYQLRAAFWGSCCVAEPSSCTLSAASSWPTSVTQGPESSSLFEHALAAPLSTSRDLETDNHMQSEIVTVLSRRVRYCE